MTAPTVQVRRRVKAGAEQIFDLWTRPELMVRWMSPFPGAVDCKASCDLRPGGAFVTRSNEQMRAMGLAEVIIDGEVIEADPPHRLVQTYRFLFTDQNKAEGFTRLTWEIELTPGGFTRLTVTHDLTGAPMGAGMVTSKFSNQGGGGWNWILSDLKSLLETGENL